ncbi:MAG: afsK 1 [Gemmataceae bacterium]|nr:afsK 1 [Gemmataceae bacterium]
MRHLCLTSVLALTFAVTLSAADWPRFRGPNGTGVADGPLPPVDAKTALWKVPVPGRGVSSPIVVGGKLFLQTASDDGSKRLLLCINPADGKTVWTRELAGAKGKTHAKNSLASGSPAGDGERVYCTAWDGDGLNLVAYDLAGKELWTQPLGSYVSQHGPGHSPVTHAGLIFVNMDQDGGAVLLAFDAKTGEKKWAAGRKPYRASYSTPFVLERPGRPAEIVLGTTTAVTGYEPLTGKVLWSYAINWPAGTMPLRVVGSPVAAAGLVICYCGDGGGARYAVAIDPDGREPAKVWEATKGPTPYVPCMLAKDDLLFWIADNGIACCAEAKTGKVLWEERVSVKDVTASPVLVGDEILVIAETGRVYVLKAGREYELVRTGDIGQPVSASPAVADGKVYVRGATHLFCFGKK